MGKIFSKVSERGTEKEIPLETSERGTETEMEIPLETSERGTEMEIPLETTFGKNYFPVALAG